MLANHIRQRFVLLRIALAFPLAGCPDHADPAVADTAGSSETGVTMGDGSADEASAPETGMGTFDADSGGDASGSDGALTDDGDSDDTSGGPTTCPAAVTLQGHVQCAAPTATDFAASVEWEWHGGDGLYGTGITPLVANLTDDNGDGVVDLCDTPDIVVVVSDHEPLGPDPRGVMVAFDGATGSIHWQAPLDLAMRVDPALGDIDGDGLVEIVAVRNDEPTMAWDGPQSLVAVSNTGQVQWESQYTMSGTTFRNSLRIADLDTDGDVEIVLGQLVFDHLGGIEAVLADPVTHNLDHSAVADLDGDGDLEIVTGPAGAVHHDGTVLFPPPPELPTGPTGVTLGLHQVADYDGDGEPEVLLQGFGDLAVYRADGTTTMQRDLGGYAPDGVPVSADLDGDGVPEIAVGDEPNLAVYRGDGSLVFAVDVWTGLTVPTLSQFTARATAFDFLGQGHDQLIVNDGFVVRTFDDGIAVPELGVEVSGGGTPVVADIDNDGSAEIIVTSNPASADGFTIRVLGAADGDWARARRIFNQSGYSVTNVLEDGTIPSQVPPAWSLGIGYGGQVWVDGDGSLCAPPR